MEAAGHLLVTEAYKDGHQVERSTRIKETLWNRLRESSLTITEEGTSALKFLKNKVRGSLQDDKDAFFVADLDEVVKQHMRFLKALPQVKPFYAVKCNSSPEILRTLAIIGAGFDCASKAEITWVLDMGVPAANIIYANPCKQPSYIRFAAQRGVTKMTFDCENELVKVAEHHPNAEMVLRIQTDDEGSVVRLSNKFGAPLQICEQLLKKAKHLNVSVIGVSFHIGSSTTNLQGFHQAIGNARHVFDIGNKLGHKMRLLDIGGGFPGHPDFKPAFEEFADVIMESLDQYFPNNADLEIIAEPGRYYVTSAFTEAVNITTKKEESVKDSDGKERKMFSYYLNDGAMGSFLLSRLYKKEMNLIPFVGKDCLSSSVQHFPSRLWGPSCADRDILYDNIDLPELEVGDWLLFPNIGAYFPALYTVFNGFLPPPVYYIMSQKTWRLLETQLNNPSD